MSAPPRVSVAVPLYNEASGIPELLRRLGTTLDRVPGGPHEIVLVDDGSSDGTLALLEAAAASDRRLVILSLSRNFGHQAALSAALDQVSGDVTVVMDGDLQDPPELIPAFLEQYAQGYDVVYAQRLRRKEAWWLRLCYFVFYRALRRLSSVAVPVDAGDFGLMSRRVVDTVGCSRDACVTSALPSSLSNIVVLPVVLPCEVSTSLQLSNTGLSPPRTATSGSRQRVGVRESLTSGARRSRSP